MENQHRKIVGYRELDPSDIDLMNRIKAKGKELLELQSEVVGRLNTDQEYKAANALSEKGGDNLWEGAVVELERFNAAQPQRWAAIGKTDIETGIMALVRAVAQPA